MLIIPFRLLGSQASPIKKAAARRRRLVIGSENVRVGLQEEPNVGVPDPLTDHLRAYAGVERAGGVRVAQIMGG